MLAGDLIGTLLRTCTTKSPKDPVIEEMEKFMKETENSEVHPLNSNKGKIYDTENLLHILGSKTSPKNIDKSCVGCPPPVDKPKMRVLPKLRKIQKKSEEPPPKKAKIKKKAAPLRLLFAQEHTIRIKWEECEKIVFPKKKRATRHHYCKSHKTKLVLVKIRNDSKVVRIDRGTLRIRIKQENEVIDLTNLEGNSCYMLIHFGEQHDIEQLHFEIAEDLPPTQYQKVAAKVIASERATTTISDVRDDLSLVVDLTEVDDRVNDQLVAISEKECANTILPIIYRFYQLSQVGPDIGKSLECCSFSEKTRVVGYHLVQTLSDMFVKNINLSRFLDIVMTKLEERYKLQLSTATIAYYLKTMFEENRHYCKNKLTKTFLREIDNYYGNLKTENVIFAVDEHGVIDLEVEVFTQDQLKLLADQIRQYHQLMTQIMSIDDEEHGDSYVLTWTGEKVEIN